MKQVDLFMKKVYFPRCVQKYWVVFEKQNMCFQIVPKTVFCWNKKCSQVLPTITGCYSTLKTTKKHNFFMKKNDLFMKKLICWWKQMNLSLETINCLDYGFVSSFRVSNNILWWWETLGINMFFIVFNIFEIMWKNSTCFIKNSTLFIKK